MNLNRFLSGLIRQVTGASSSPPRQDDGEDGIGVPIPVAPRPLRGGAQAKLPASQDEEFDSEWTSRR